MWAEKDENPNCKAQAKEAKHTARYILHEQRNQITGDKAGQNGVKQCQNNLLSQMRKYDSKTGREHHTKASNQ